VKGLGNLLLSAAEPAECRALGLGLVVSGSGFLEFRVQGFRAFQPAESWEVGHRT